MTFLHEEPIEIGPLSSAVTSAHRGAVATFVGLVRNHQDGRPVDRLEYHAYPAMAESECAAIVAEAEARWPVSIALAHRVGPLAVGDVAIAVAAAGDHRSESFEACRWVVEQVKHRVPIWKKEFYAGGEVSWVDPTRLDVPLTPDPLGTASRG